MNRQLSSRPQGHTVLFCFIFLYLFAVGAGPFSLDAWLRRRRDTPGTP